jgi:hypothetical protein
MMDFHALAGVLMSAAAALVVRGRRARAAGGYGRDSVAWSHGARYRDVMMSDDDSHRWNKTLVRRPAMNEHDDDLEAEVEEDAEFEKEAFPILTDDEEAEINDEESTAPLEDDLDPDKSEI